MWPTNQSDTVGAFESRGVRIEKIIRAMRIWPQEGASGIARHTNDAICVWGADSVDAWLQEVGAHLSGMNPGAELVATDVL